MLPLLSVCLTNKTEKTFSIFSRDPSRSLTLSQHCTRHAQWATNLPMWACFPPPFSIHWYAAFSAIGKLAWAFVSSVRPSLIKQSLLGSWSLGVHVHVCHVRWDCTRAMLSRLICWNGLHKHDFCEIIKSKIRHSYEAHSYLKNIRFATWFQWIESLFGGNWANGPSIRVSTFFSCPILSLHLKWPLCIRYWCVVLICYRFC